MKRHPSDTHVFPDGKAFRLINERILVQMDEESDKVGEGLLYKPENAHEHAYGTGTILAFGYVTERKLPDTTKTKAVEPFPIPDIEVGLKGLFIKFRKLQDSNKVMQEIYGDGVILLKPDDLIVVYPKGFTPDFNQ